VIAEHDTVNGDENPENDMSTKARKREGRCLCGAVSMIAHTSSDEISACHCNMCRRWAGTALVVLHCGTSVEIDGEEHVSVFDSSEWAQRGFCTRCGTNLYYRLKGAGTYSIPVGLFADDAALEFTQQIFFDEKPAYFNYVENTEKYTGAEVMAGKHRHKQK